MKNLAESYKGMLGHKEPNNSSFENQSLPLRSSLTAENAVGNEMESDDYVPASKATTSKRNLYDMPKLMHDSGSLGDLDNIENVNSSANKKYRKMFSPSNVNNSPYF